MIDHRNAPDRLHELAAWATLVAPEAREPVFTVVCAGIPSDAVRELAALTKIDIVDAGSSFDEGMATADRVADTGSNAILTIAEAGAVTTSAITGLLTRAHAAQVTNFDTDDVAWMHACGEIREAMLSARPLIAEPRALLESMNDPGLAAIAGVISQGSERGLGIVLDTASTTAAALIVERMQRRLTSTWVAATRSNEPAQHRALDRFELTPVLDLNSRTLGIGALSAASVIRAACLALH